MSLYNNDGRVDIAINSIGGRLILLQNDGPSAHWLEVQVEPFSPGAVVTLLQADGRSVVREVHAGTSYLSSEDPRVHFGLGSETQITEIELKWPSGTVQVLHNVKADQILTVTEE